MATTGPLQNGVAQIVRRGTRDVIGYSFAEASGGGQMQRWLLFEDPNNAFEIQPPPDAMKAWSLTDWKVNVPGLWKPGSRYVRAQSNAYQHGGTYAGVSWARIPNNSKLPAPTYPPAGDDLQLDPEGGRALDILQDGVRGHAFTIRGLTDASNAEYWLLTERFMPAGLGATAAVTVGAKAARTLQDFVNLANQSWGPGCVFCITGCVNYSGTAAPGTT